MAALLCTVLYIAPITGRGFWNANALALGTWVAVVFWLVYPSLDRRYATAAAQSPGWYALVVDRIEDLRRHVEDRTWRRRDACVDEDIDEAIRDQAKGRLSRVRNALEDPGLGWVTRDRFNAVWSEVHAVEDELITILPMSDVTQVALEDVHRLNGSSIADADHLAAKLRMAVRELDPDADRYFEPLSVGPADGWRARAPSGPSSSRPINAAGAAPGPSPGGGQPAAAPGGAGQVGGASPMAAPRASTAPRTTSVVGPASDPAVPPAATTPASAGAPAAAPWQAGAPTHPAATPSSPGGAGPPDPRCVRDARARAVIQAIHRSVSAYRGGLWADLGRARWLLVRTTAVAGLVSYLVLALALLANVRTVHLETAWAYFLAGAIAGLFLRLYTAGGETQVRDDYGLEVARLYQTPLLSGIAAIIGVILMALIAGSTLGDVIAPGGTAPRPTSAPTAPPAAQAAAVSTPVTTPAPVATPAAAEEPTDEAPTPEQVLLAAKLEDAFVLARYPIGLVIALAFGLTPGLVLDRLGASLSGTKKALATSRAASSGSSGSA
jgi:hypothetical protein